MNSDERIKELREFLNADELPENAEKMVFEEKTVLRQIDDLGPHLLLSRFATEKMLGNFIPLVKNAIKDFAIGVGMLFILVFSWESILVVYCNGWVSYLHS